MTPAQPVPGLAVPVLLGMPAVIGSSAGRRDRARLALAMLDAGVASPALWKPGSKSPDYFLKRALNDWVAVRCDEAVRERFSMRIRLDFDLDPWSSWRVAGSDDHRGAMEAGDRIFLTLESEYATLFPFGATFAWLERFDPQLPATVYQLFSEVKRALYVYDWHEAAEYDQMRADGLDDEDLAAYRADIPEILLPTCLERMPLRDAQVRRRRRSWPAEVCRVLEAARAVAVASKAVSYGTTQEREARHKALIQGDYTRTPPSMVIATEEGDRVCAAFDDDMMGDDGCPPEPLRFWIIDRPTPAAVRRAFDGLDQVLSAVAAATRFFDATPGKGRVAPDSLAAVLDVPGEGCGPLRVRAA